MSERPIHFRGGIQEQGDGTFTVIVEASNFATKEDASAVTYAIRKPIAKAVMELYPDCRTEGLLDN